MKNIGSTIHLPGLNGIRTIAAIAVLLGHTDTFLSNFSVPELGLPFSPSYGVTLFFVLSGYLITYLLLIEKKATSDIHIKSFYLRRILRIWPLYYLLIIISLFVLNLYGTSIFAEAKKLLLYIFFLPNASFALGQSIKPIEPLWSVGVEEQFYLVWPLLIRYSKNIFKSLLLVIAGYLALKGILFAYGEGYWLISLTRIDCMAIGGLAAYGVLNHQDKIQFLTGKIPQLMAIGALASILCLPFHTPDFFIHELYSILFGILLINISTNQKSLIKLDSRLFSFFGSISFGLYMFHLPVILVCAYFLNGFFPPTLFGSIIVLVMILTITVLISYLSYHYYEKFFLKLKDKFTFVKSSSTSEELDAQLKPMKILNSEI